MESKYMIYTDKTKPGMGDPYWYEWSVGQQYIIDMLNPDNKILYVELQANVQLGLDDVVVTYENGKKLFVQVKHTRTENTLTFGDLVSVNQDKEETSKYSLLGELAKSWNDEKNNYQDAKILLFTNRKKGTRPASAGENRCIKRPALKKFLESLHEQLLSIKSFEELKFPGYEDAWEEWKNQLICIEDDKDKLAFLKNLHIKTDQMGLEEIEKDLLKRLEVTFNVNGAIAQILLTRLDHALREWTSSIRKGTRITGEDVYNKLSLSENYSTYNHDLIPADPFFESRNGLVNEIEGEILEGNSKVLFLSGIPGTGKTNIISKICNKRSSVVDIRYYAYEPINPAKEYLPMDVSQRVNIVNFWNELFNQLRKVLKGSLLKYHVPVVNDLMDTEELRNKFFEIASAYASDCGRTFVIAIDGIDHAARAGVYEDTFLPTLPNPEYMPANVKIILAGQPKESYPNYPSWLFYDSIYVKQIEAPQLSGKDIMSLVEDKFPGHTREQNFQMTELIEKYAEGNTLAAIFATHEAVKQPNLILLEQNLKNRKLSGNIQEYYKAIWDEAKSRISSIPFIDYKIAGAFAFFNEPITAEKLHNIYAKESVSISIWENVLKALSPLLEEHDGKYVILHNDVRVYLSGVIGLDTDHVKEIYGNLVDYYLKLEQKSRAYYYDIFRFLKGAGREDEFEKVYSADFIIEAYVNGVETSELRELSAEILKNIISKKKINWDQMRTLAIGYMTIDQIEKSQYEIEDCDFRRTVHVMDIHPYECFVEPVTSWNIDILSNVLTVIKSLYLNNECQRAIGLFCRWFSGTNITQIWTIIKYAQEEEDFLSPKLKKFAVDFGECIGLSGALDIMKGSRLLAKDNSPFVYNLVEAILKYAFQHLRGKKLVNVLGTLEIIYINPLVEGIKKLLDENRYSDIHYIERTVYKRLFDSSMGILIDTFMQIISSRIYWSAEDTDKLWDSIKKVELPDETIENLMTYYSMYAIVAAYLQEGVSRTEIASVITDRYMANHSYQKRAYFGVYFNNMCFLGKWLKKKHSNQELLEDPRELRQLMSALFLKTWHPNDRDFETMYLRAYILKAYIILSSKGGMQYKKVVDEICIQIFSTNPVNQLLEAGIFYYQNDKERIQMWFDDWLKENGKVWTESLSERNRIIQSFIRVKEKYDTEDVIDVSEALEKAQWSVIGYVSHKEYSGDDMLQWYSRLVEYDDSYIFKYAETIKEISDKMEEIGDNRLEYRLNCKIYSDLFGCGILKIKDILQNQHYLSQTFSTPSYFVEGLIGYLKKAHLDESELIEIWAIGMGLLDWRNEDNHDTIHSLQRAIEICAESNGIYTIYDQLKYYGAAYIDLIGDPVKYIIPDRWCDGKVCKSTKIVSEADIVAYMEDNNNSLSQSELKENVELLKSEGAIHDKVLENLLKFEFEKESYSIQHNSLIEYLMEVVGEDTSDQIIKAYLENVLQKEHRYFEYDLPELVKWKIFQKGEDYCKSGLDDIICMQRSWMTAAGHFEEPELSENYNFCSLIDWKKSTSIGTLFYQILKNIILSEDADAVRVALTGLYALIKNNNLYIENIEIDWNQYHYRAKEWLMMLYELLWHEDVKSKPILQKIIALHRADEDFNVALYANLLFENMCPELFSGYIKKTQQYFGDIPAYGLKRLIKTKRNTTWINGSDCVMEMKELIENKLNVNLDDVEKRTADYSHTISDIQGLIKLNRPSLSYKIVVDKVNRAFLRVLYKDWVAGRWDYEEMTIARTILSASEPFIMLVTPMHWNYNNGALIDNVEKFPEISKSSQIKSIKEILNTGLAEDEILLGGCVVDYTYKKEILGYLLSYWNIPGMKPEYAAYSYERNSRMFLQCRYDFIEDTHFNITLHHNGIESFKQSNIVCGFSKKALEFFEWQVEVCYDGLKVIDNKGKIIGRFETYYGNRGSIGNRYHSNQPYLQRWIIYKKELEKTLYQVGVPNLINDVADIVIKEFD